jgi:proliferating cell nuclear antigen
MLIKLADPKLLSDSIGIISEIVTEVRIKVSKAGLGIIAVDPANVALVSLKIPHSAFTHFESEDENLCVNLEDLKQVLKRAEPGSSLTIQKEDNKLKLSIENTVKRHFYLALISLEQEEKKIPELEFDSSVELASEMLKHAIEDAAVVSDACSFEIGKNFTIEAKGALNSTRTEFSSDEAKFKGEAKSKYSLEYLQKFIKAGRFADKANIQYKTDFPLRLDFRGNVEMTFILAPRVEDE